jgi:hypothetical protein
MNSEGLDAVIVQLPGPGRADVLLEIILALEHSKAARSARTRGSPMGKSARLTSQVQLRAPRLKGQVIDDPEPEPFR